MFFLFALSFGGYDAKGGVGIRKASSLPQSLHKSVPYLFQLIREVMVRQLTGEPFWL